MKKYIAMGLMLAMMVGVAGCDSATENMDMLAQMMETADQITTVAVDPNAQGEQTLMENGDNGEAAGANENQTQGNEVNGNSTGNVNANNASAANKSSNNQANQQQNRTAAGNAQVNNNAQAKANNSSGNNAANNTQTKANNSTQTANNQAQNKPASNNSDKKDETTKATTTVKTTVVKKERYYICNQCGFKSNVKNGTAGIRAHLSESVDKYLAGKISKRCSGYHTGY